MKKISIITLVIVAALLFTQHSNAEEKTTEMAQKCAKENRFPNPSFENWNDSGTLPLHWEPWTPPARRHLLSCAPDTTIKKNGECSLKITAATNFNLGKRVPNTPGETYTISGWVHAQKKGALRLYFALLTEKGWKGEVLKSDDLKKDFTLTPGKWMYVSFTGTTPKHMPLCEAYFYFTTDRPNIFHVDSVSFKKKKNPEPHRTD